ncbi:FecCD family ABC transporter permease [Roseburia sp. 831b]|uniref:FecCD family ABC transporter permease n=1 Tax=Roseburia sp. 831b TaxID=1261635 RepID=UPI000AE53AFE|nr:iron ABC transporter permease [Roseburia sp. 831b]WVK73408.1 iron ABC transporter permease [Roseburia sp. 831b]
MALKKKIGAKRIVFVYVFTTAALLLLLFASVNIGSIKVTPMQMLKGLFVAYDEQVATIYHLRFPRIFIAMAGGAAVAVSGVLLQAVMKNPLADPGILGISSGASLASVLITMFFPAMFFSIPVFAFLGGIAACALVYVLSWKGGLHPLRVILTGVAVNAFFTGLLSAGNSMLGKDYTGAASIIDGNISMKTWDDFKMLIFYTVIGLVLSLVLAKYCDILGLEDKTILSLGIHVNASRMGISVVAVLLASVSTAVMGSISFLGLLVPHIARLLVGNSHKILLPYTMILGAFTLLAADTLGRTIAYPYEISAAVVMAVIGGPCFILLLRRSAHTYEQG